MIRLSKLTLGYASAVLFSAVFMRQVVLAVIRVIGEWGMEICVWLFYAVAAFAATAYFFRRRLPFIRGVFLMLLFVLAVVLARQIVIPVERIHIIKYGIMGWLASGDVLKGEHRLFPCLLFAFFFCLCCSALDEIFQFFIPGRVSQVSDVILGCLGAIFGIMMRVLGR